jgi:hypothetical protein
MRSGSNRATLIDMTNYLDEFAIQHLGRRDDGCVQSALANVCRRMV